MANTGVNAVPQAGVIQGVISLEGQKAAYMVAKTALALAATPTVVASIQGSATKTIKVRRVRISGAAATASQNIPVELRKTSTAFTGGTATAPTPVPVDSNLGAATAVVSYFTANPTEGTSVGAVASGVVPCLLATAAGAPGFGSNHHDLIDPYGEGITLRGTAQCLDVHLLGVTLNNTTTMNISFEFTEE